MNNIIPIGTEVLIKTHLKYRKNAGIIYDIKYGRIINQPTINYNYYKYECEIIAWNNSTNTFCKCIRYISETDMIIKPHNLFKILNL